MKIIELIDLIYSRKKDNTLSHHAKKFIKKYSLNIEEEIEIDSAILLATTISNSEKRNSVVAQLLEVKNKSTKKGLTIDLRTNSYKKVCRHFHPDNLETGDENTFKFIQEIKESFWDYLGNPRKEISKLEWDLEKEMKSFKGDGFEWRMHMRRKASNKN